MRFAKLKVLLATEKSYWDQFLPTDIKRLIERPAEPEKTVVAILVTAEPSTNYQYEWLYLDMTYGDVVKELNAALTDDKLENNFPMLTRKPMPMPVDLAEVHDEDPVDVSDLDLDRP